MSVLVYYINLLLILGLAYPLCLYKPGNLKKVIYLLITFGYMWFLATFRMDIGFDYQTYIDIFHRLAGSSSFSELMSTEFEPGYALLNWVMGRFISDPVVMYGVFGVMIYVPVMWFIYRYSKDVWLSTWLYVTLSYFYSTMNFTRQNLSLAVMVLGYRFLRDKKPVPFFIIVLLSASLHKTALIMIPVYFLCHIRLDKKLGILYGGATIFFFLTSVPIVDFVTNYIFSQYKGTIYIDPAYGFPPIFLLVPFTVFGGCLALYPVWRKRDPDADMLINLMLYNAAIWLFITRHFILERFSHYLFILALVAVPAALSALKAPDEDYALLAELKAQDAKKGKNASKSKEAQNKYRTLAVKISDHRKYYWSAVAALLLITLIYNEFGQHVNHFHGVFPYQSVLPWFG